MPPKPPVDHGRGFDSYGALMWAQRVDKEERAYLGEDRRDAKRRSRAMARKADTRLERLESKFDVASERSERSSRRSERQLAASSSAPAMYSTGSLPQDLRALQRFGIADANLITMRGQKADDQGLVPRLRMRPVEVDAHWVPGSNKLVRYMPEFVLEREGAKATGAQPWSLPPAGGSKAGSAAASSRGPFAQAAEGTSAPGPREKRGSVASLIDEKCVPPSVRFEAALGSTAKSGATSSKLVAAGRSASQAFGRA